jgi:hypothetical protein
MSAKNIGGPSREFDTYYTPLGLAEEMCMAFEAVNGGAPGTVLEPSAGEGVFPYAATELGWWGSCWDCVEIRDQSPPFFPPCPDGEYGFDPSWINNTNFLTFNAGRYDLCIGNPPFTLAQEFVEKALSCSTQVMFLLRLGFLASKKRGKLFAEHPPANIWVLESRPSFTGKGTDSADYCVVHWDDRKDYTTRTHWLRGAWK